MSLSARLTRLFKQAITYVMLVSLQLVTFSQSAHAAGAVIGTGLSTGSLSQGLRAGEIALTRGSIQTLATVIVLGGLGLTGLDDVLGSTGTSIVSNSVGSAAATSYLSGGSFGDALLDASLQNIVNVASAGAAKDIGTQFPNLDGTNLLNYAAHAGLGCVSASATGGNCAAGAAGAAAGEAAAATGLLNLAAAGFGQTLTDGGTVFFGGLVGGIAASGAGSNDSINANFATGQATAQNAVTNNYLNHKDQLERDALEQRKKDGNCDEICLNRLGYLNAYDAATNSQLKRCEGVTSPECDGARILVREAAADYIRQDQLFKNGINYAAESIETLTLAQDSVSGKYKGVIVSVSDLLKNTWETLGTAILVSEGDAEAIARTKAAAKSLSNLLKDSSNWPYLIGVMTPDQREQFAQALEKGDGTTVGKMLTDQMIAVTTTITVAGKAVGITVKAAEITSAAVKEGAIRLAAEPAVAGEIAVARTSTGSSSTRVSNGIALHPDLPDPAAGLGYTPKVLDSSNSNIANSQINGYLGELKLANEVARLPNQSVIKYGDTVGTHGADVISVNKVTGEVTLWDNKFRSNPVTMSSSPTFDPGSSALTSALEDAQVSIRNSNLLAAAKDLALQNLNKGNFITNTPGSGAVKNSTTVRFCSGIPC